MKVYIYSVFVFMFFCTFAETWSEEPNKERHLFPVARDGKIGFIDQDGKIVLPCEYSMYTQPDMDCSAEWFRMAWRIANDDGLKIMDEENTFGYFYYIPENKWSDGIIPIVKDGKIGFVRENGTVIAKP